MIRVEHLEKRYGDIKAVDDISFTVGQGEILGFLGPNGAGKTTTMRVLTGFLPPTSGKIEIAGHDIVNEPLAVKRRIGYLPEQPPLYLDMSVRSYLSFVAKIRDVPRAEMGDRIAWAMKKCGLVDVGRRLLGNLSKGYKQRVGLAQAILHNPDLLILDEPTVGLDPRQIREIRELIRELAGEHTVILSTHILPEVSMTCKRILIINRGRIIEQGLLDEITRQSALEEVFINLITRDDEGGLQQPQEVSP